MTAQDGDGFEHVFSEFIDQDQLMDEAQSPDTATAAVFTPESPKSQEVAQDDDIMRDDQLLSQDADDQMWSWVFDVPQEQEMASTQTLRSVSPSDRMTPEMRNAWDEMPTQEGHTSDDPSVSFAHPAPYEDQHGLQAGVPVNPMRFDYPLPIRPPSQCRPYQSQHQPHQSPQNGWTSTVQHPCGTPGLLYQHHHHVNGQTNLTPYVPFATHGYVAAHVSDTGQLVPMQTITYWQSSAPTTVPMPMHYPTNLVMYQTATAMDPAAAYATQSQRQYQMPALAIHNRAEGVPSYDAHSVHTMQQQPSQFTATFHAQGQESSSGSSPTSSPSQLTRAQHSGVIAQPRQAQSALATRARRTASVRERVHISRTRQLLPKYGPPSPPSRKEGNKGGRTRSLSPDRKVKAKVMREEGGCWKCVLLRIRCDLGTGDECSRRCTRCKTARTGDPSTQLPCCRIKLPQLTDDFLPDSLTSLHKEATIADVIATEVASWTNNSFVIFLSMGWGKTLQPTVCEIVPTNPGATLQYQYFQNPKTRLMEPVQKFSPPLAIRKVASGRNIFDEYVDSLCTEEYLQDFTTMCYASESRHEKFQEELLRLLCRLYLAHKDTPERRVKKVVIDIRALLHSILRMLILTYIMGHSLTIVESNLPDVFEKVRVKPKGKQKQICPRLTNRQLKRFFNELRHQVYELILRQMQNYLIVSSCEDETWMAVFCCMLAYAMVLEEVQGSMQIQADAKTRTEGVAWEDAQKRARAECELVDERFRLMVLLFQKKYRSKKWTPPGPFANQTPKPTYAADHEFLVDLRKLVDDKREYLESQAGIPLGAEYQCHYTSRLVARFLLPFKYLPA